MKDTDNQTYYSKDYRFYMMLLALIQLIGVVAAVTGLIVCSSNLKMGIIIAIVGGGVAWLFGDLTIKMSAKWIKFKEGCEATNVVYGEIEDIKTVTKLKFVPEDMGGIYLDKDEVVIGSLKGERRCAIEDLSYELVNHNALVNYIKITIDNEVIAFVPKWTGPVSEQPSSADKAVWGYGCLQKLVPNSEPEPEADLTPDPYG